MFFPFCAHEMDTIEHPVSEQENEQGRDKFLIVLAMRSSFSSLLNYCLLLLFHVISFTSWSCSDRLSLMASLRQCTYAAALQAERGSKQPEGWITKLIKKCAVILNSMMLIYHTVLTFSRHRKAVGSHHRASLIVVLFFPRSNIQNLITRQEKKSEFYEENHSIIITMRRAIT